MLNLLSPGNTLYLLLVDYFFTRANFKDCESALAAELSG